MDEYLIIIKILEQVLDGKNLGELYNKEIIKDNLNTGKVKDLSFGVVRYYFRLNLILDQLAQRPITNNKVKLIIIIAIYEIIFTHKAQYAIGNDMVDLVYKLTKKEPLKKFVNAVIRNFIRNQNQIISKLEQNYQYQTNLPKWWVNKIKAQHPENQSKIIDSFNQEPSIYLRINPNKTNLDNYQESLNEAHIEYELIGNAIKLKQNIKVIKIPGFEQGHVSIQDINAMKLIEFVPLKDGLKLLDACSAPGGKACQILENYPVDLTALEIDSKRLTKVAQNIKRLELKAKIINGDATKTNWWDLDKFDVIIVDVPCSASGTLKRNPDIKLNREENDIVNFTKTQRAIVENLWNMLKEKGQLVYITCSIFNEENQENIEYFLTKLPQIKLIKMQSYLPLDQGDGFFYALLQKESL